MDGEKKKTKTISPWKRRTELVTHFASESVPATDASARRIVLTAILLHRYRHLQQDNHLGDLVNCVRVMATMDYCDVLKQQQAHGRYYAQKESTLVPKRFPRMPAGAARPLRKPHHASTSSNHQDGQLQAPSRREALFRAMWKTDLHPRLFSSGVPCKLQRGALQKAENAEKLKGYAKWEVMRDAAKKVRTSFLPLFNPAAPIVDRFEAHIKEAMQVAKKVRSTAEPTEPAFDVGRTH